MKINIRYRLLIILMIFTILFTGCGKNKEDVDNLVYVKTQKIMYDKENNQNNYSGVVKGRYESNLAFQVSGKIIARNVNLGDKVSSGDILMVIDDKDIKQNVNLYEAQMQSAKSQLNLTKINLSRYKELYAVNAVSAQELDQYQSAYDNAVAMYNQAIAQLTQGENALGYTDLIADNTGVISNITGEVGQVISAGQTVITLVQDGNREIEIAVPENKIHTITLGQEAKITFWALDNVEVKGIVREISPIADSVSRTYKVRISLENTPLNIQLGMTANVIFEIKDDLNYSILPLTALYQTENKTQVWIVNSQNRLELKDVKVIEFGKNDIKVTGLLKDDIVVVAGVHKLYEGQIVKLLDGDAL